MSIRSIFRYILAAMTIACLVVGLNNCAAPAPTASTPQSLTETVSAGDSKININTAILSELDKLEARLGVPALSNKIQASRPYGSVDDLVAKQVLTQAQFDQVKNQVTVEDIVLTGEAKDVDYMTKLALMKGHLLVAGELLDRQLPKQAEPHLGHPVEEIYVDIADQLPDRKVAEFSGVLTKVQDLVKSKPGDPQIPAAFNDANKAVDTAIAALPSQQLASPAFTLQVINEVLDTAAAEYTAAISGGKISAAIEYQDSRGFVNYVKNTLLKGIQPQLAKENAALDQDLNAKISELAKAWTDPVPPATPVVSAESVQSQIKAIEQASRATKPAA